MCQQTINYTPTFNQYFRCLPTIYEASGPQILVPVVLAAVRCVRSDWLHLMDLVLIQALRKVPSKDQLHEPVMEGGLNPNL
jgi:hypothetical protein